MTEKPKKKPWYNRWQTAVLVLVPAVIICAIAFGNVGSKSSSQNTKAIPTKPSDPEATIKSVAEKSLNAREVEITKQVDGGYGVLVSYDTKDTSRIKEEMAGGYADLYKSGQDIKQVTISAYANYESQSGQQKDDVVYKTTLGKPYADKANFDDPSSVYRLWQVQYARPGLNLE